MRSILITTALIVICSVANAQQTVTISPNQIFTAVEQEPMPAGGMSSFFKYLGENTKYPDSAAKKRIEGKVFVTFVVEKDGSLTDAKILRGVSPDIDAEAIRVISTAPKWKPGIQNGIPVRVQYTVVVNFKLPPQSAINDSKKMDSIMNLPIDQKIFTAVEQEPTPVGGMGTFYEYLMTNIHYPEYEKRNNIQGKVFLTFVVEKDGTLNDIRVLRGVSRGIDVEAIRVLKNAPKWNPGMQSGRPVRVQYNVPLSFSLKTVNDH
ncbi:MAG: energy transducer TonB [Sphingobacteriales bacterium]